ncbi:MAG: hypothetical protein SVZ03_04920 [Spirochaetota bacterium]|nr:hypothetical protein [Spirochaetota bacterium]
MIRDLIKWTIYAGASIAIYFSSNTIALCQEAQYDWFWILYEYERNENYQTKVWRPFFMRNTENSKGNVFEASLIPIVYWKNKTVKKNEWKSLFGLINSVDYIHPNGVSDYDFGVFPFLLYGDSVDKNDKYCHIWPFGGSMRDKLGQDNISTYLFPGFVLFFFFPPSFPPTLTNAAVLLISLIPLYVNYNSKDYKSWGLLWPIIQRGKSSTRNDKRFLPFYSHNYTRDKYESHSILMLFNYQRVIMRDDEQKTFFAVPFFGKRWNRSSLSNSSTLLWPFFSWGYDIKRGDYELNFPWPLVQIQDCSKPYINKRIFFPFFGKYDYQNKRTFFITPLYFSLKKKTKSYDSEYYINALIIWYFKREYKKKPSPTYGSSWRYFKIWPIFHYEKDDRGNFSFNFLSLLPMRDPEGYERLYQPFWTIFEYRGFQSGERRFGLLWRLYFQRWSRDLLYIKIPLLFSYATSHGRLTKLSFLFSMFGYYNETDKRSIRIFWIPIELKATATLDKSHNRSNQKGNIIQKEDDLLNKLKTIEIFHRKALDFEVRRDFLLYSKRVF